MNTNYVIEYLLNGKVGVMFHATVESIESLKAQGASVHIVRSF